MAKSKLVVLGGGPAGDVAALRGAQLGAEVSMIEKAELGGTCLNWGCIPTKSLLATADLLRRIRKAAEFGIEIDQEVKVNFSQMMTRKNNIVNMQRSGVESVCKRKGINVVYGQGIVEKDAVLVDDKRYPYDKLIVAVGTKPAGLPNVDMEHPLVLTSDDILRLQEIPKRLLIVGGGVIGCEFASLFAPLGTEITVVEMLPQILPGIDSKIAAQFRRFMEKEGVKFQVGRKLTSVTKYSDKELTVKFDDGTEISTDRMLISIGRRSQTSAIGLEKAGVVIDQRGYIEVDDYLRTANPKVWAAGDCIGGLQLAHLASAEALRAVENALDFQVRPIDRTVVPACIYTHPEIATVGLNADMAKAAGIEIKVGQARFAGNGKALSEGETDGLVQLVAEKQTGVLLGATIMGTHAVEIIHEVGVAIADSLTLTELGDIIHAHPTVSELIMDAAQVAEGLSPYHS